MSMNTSSIFKCVYMNIRKIKFKYNRVSDCSTSTKMEGRYTVKLIGEQDIENVIKFLRRTFYIDEPLNAAVGLITSDNDKCPELDEYCRSSLLEGLSFKAVDDKDNVVGVNINGIIPLKQESDGNDILRQAEGCKNPKFQKILYIMGKQWSAAKLWERYPQDKILLEIKIAATDSGWRQRGIMKALVNKTEEATKYCKIGLIRIDASSVYSGMTAERLGFTCVQKALYKDIKMDGRPIIVPEPPHMEYRIYVKKMRL